MPTPFFLLLVALVSALTCGLQLSWLASNEWRHLAMRLAVSAVVAVVLIIALRWWLGQVWQRSTRGAQRIGQLLLVASPLALGWLLPVVMVIYPSGRNGTILLWLIMGAVAWNVLTWCSLRWSDRLAIAVLLGGFTVVINVHLIGLASGTGDSDAGSVQENRTLAALPAAPTSLATAAAWPQAWEPWFNDHFRHRLGLIHFGSWVDIMLLNRNADPWAVCQGRDGWLFRGSEERRRDYRRRFAFSAQERQEMVTALSNRKALSARYSPRFLLVLAPDKSSVYPEALTDYRIDFTKPNKGDQLLDQAAQAGVDRLDLRATLRNSPLKAQAPLYYRTDTHWNRLGGWIGAQTIIAELGLRYQLPGMTPQPFSAYRLEWEDHLGGDLARFLGDPALFTERNPVPEPIVPPRAHRAKADYLMNRTLNTMGLGVVDIVAAYEVDDPSLPTAVVFHDSFGWYMRPHLAEHFRRVVFVVSYCGVVQEVLEREHPDVVIQERVEEHVHHLARSDFADHAQGAD